MIQLQPFTRDDFARLIGWIPSPDFLVQWAGQGRFTYPLDEAQLTAYLKTSQGENPTAVIQKVVARDVGAVVGHAEIYRIENNAGNLCRVLVGDPSMRGIGIGEEIIRQMLDLGFEDIGYDWIRLHVFDFNQPAIALYKKLGFVEVEFQPNTWQATSGTVWNTHRMSITADDWQARRSQR